MTLEALLSLKFRLANGEGVHPELKVILTAHQRSDLMVLIEEKISEKHTANRLFHTRAETDAG
jgi:hypothetical protein